MAVEATALVRCVASRVGSRGGPREDGSSWRAGWRRLAWRGWSPLGLLSRRVGGDDATIDSIIAGMVELDLTSSPARLADASNSGIG